MSVRGKVNPIPKSPPKGEKPFRQGATYPAEKNHDDVRKYALSGGETKGAPKGASSYKQHQPPRKKAPAGPL